MSRVGELWNRLDDDTKVAVHHALLAALRDQGDFCRAIVADADTGHVCEQCAGADCPPGEALTAYVEGTPGRVLMLGPNCWAGRMLAARQRALPGDQIPDPDQLQAVRDPGGNP